MARPRKHPRQWYRCIQAFGGMNPETGEPNDCAVGTLLPETDPRVRGNPDWFEPIDESYPIPGDMIERVTAEPATVKGVK